MCFNLPVLDTKSTVKTFFGCWKSRFHEAVNVIMLGDSYRFSNIIAECLGFLVAFLEPFDATTSSSKRHPGMLPVRRQQRPARLSIYLNL